MTRTPKRNAFLSDMLSCAIEHMDYGFPGVIEYKWADSGRDAADTYAIIFDRYEAEGAAPDHKTETMRVTIDTMAKGLAIIRKWENKNDAIKELMLADRTNGDDGDYDIVGALAVLECGVFGQVVYS